MGRGEPDWRWGPLCDLQKPHVSCCQRLRVEWACCREENGTTEGKRPSWIILALLYQIRRNQRRALRERHHPIERPLCLDVLVKLFQGEGQVGRVVPVIPVVSVLGGENSTDFCLSSMRQSQEEFLCITRTFGYWALPACLSKVERIMLVHIMS